jgi:mannose-6-phosphate isomerase-like protein (cupin superfamily)
LPDEAVQGRNTGAEPAEPAAPVQINGIPLSWLELAGALGGTLELLMFRTMALAPQPDTVAPDGMNVRLLSALAGGSMAHFELPPGAISAAVAHRTVEEIWFFLNGEGEMWRKLGEAEEITQIRPGICVTIPLHTHFQVRSTGANSLTAVAITMPPWPGEGEAFRVAGVWEASRD